MKILKENVSFTIPKSFESSSSNIVATVEESKRKIMKDSLTEIIKNNPNYKGIIVPKISPGNSLANLNSFNNLVKNRIERDILPKEATEVN
ncbi:hypothetical protein AAIE21_29150 [Paenibacillus sp. 102]|uniref:hypothetical protein n=1 Tax=Paenibacillus sp. 102 TaxID=3120823 RepID=UPI0031BB009C